MYQCTRINQRKTPYSVCRVTPCSLLQASDHLLSRWECEDAELRQELHGLQGFMAPMKDGNRHGKKWGVMDQAPEDEGYEGWRFGSQFPFILFFFTNVKGCIPYLYIYIFTHLNIHFELNLYTSPKKKDAFLVSLNPPMFSPRFYGLSSCWAPFGPLAPQERPGHRDDHLVGCLGNCTATACAETWLPEACDEFFRLGEGNKMCKIFSLQVWWNECCNIWCFVALLVTFTLFPRYNLFFMNRWFTRRWQSSEILKPLNLVEFTWI